MNRERMLEVYNNLKNANQRFIGEIGLPKSNNPNGGEIYCRVCGASTWIGIGQSIPHLEGCPVINPPEEA